MRVSVKRVVQSLAVKVFVVLLCSSRWQLDRSWATFRNGEGAIIHDTTHRRSPLPLSSTFSKSLLGDST
ncbi:Uncharacterized protein APZ42_018386 [Daphnia magna]|uniref:Uncharacterized protein n=1 Tax=Daphnia magna TaxID=35525 RepID=A0A164Z4S5_9CRUS|nr:Uncharacterized protein APZ42_018386 [Daphnia magna]